MAPYMVIPETYHHGRGSDFRGKCNGTGLRLLKLKTLVERYWGVHRSSSWYHGEARIRTMGTG